MAGAGITGVRLSVTKAHVARANWHLPCYSHVDAVIRAHPLMYSMLIQSRHSVLIQSRYSVLIRLDAGKVPSKKRISCTEPPLLCKDRCSRKVLRASLMFCALITLVVLFFTLVAPCS